jgi:hypothetical protein
MSLIRIDAPSSCGCNPEWVDTPSGPKAKCACSELCDDVHDGKSLLDEANARAEAERKEASKAGPPKGAYISTAGRVPTKGFDCTKAGPPAEATCRESASQPNGSPIAAPKVDGEGTLDRALRLQAEENARASKGGPPLGAWARD